MAISYSHLEEPLNMHETIAYLMQLAEANLLLFLYFSICLCYFFLFFLSVLYVVSKTLSLSYPFSLSLSLSRSARFYPPATNGRKLALIRVHL